MLFLNIFSLMLNDYNIVKECDYKGEHYSVRDNGAIMRHLREGKKVRKDDGVWTFGVKNLQNGYMMLGNHRVHIIVATAFYGGRDSKVYVVDHIDTNRCNNRVENLRWFTRLENMLNNEITRNKIISLCGSIEAFIENPKILQNCSMLESSLQWMRTVTKEEAAVAYKNLKEYWEKQAKNPRPISGSKIEDSIYNPIQPTSFMDNQDEMRMKKSNRPYIIKEEEWEKMTNSFRSVPIQKIQTSIKNDIEADNIIKSLTPKAVQERCFMSDKPCEYPSTPQGDYNNPLQVYANALKEGVVFWRNHEGKREYVVDKCAFSIDGQSLVVMSKAAYIWGCDENNESVEIPLSSLSPDDYEDSELDRQLNEIVYNDGVFIHKRVVTGFLPTEYLEGIYKELTGKI